MSTIESYLKRYRKFIGLSDLPERIALTARCRRCGYLAKASEGAARDRTSTLTAARDTHRSAALSDSSAKIYLRSFRLRAATLTATSIARTHGLWRTD